MVEISHEVEPIGLVRHHSQLKGDVTTRLGFPESHESILDLVELLRLLCRIQIDNHSVCTTDQVFMIFLVAVLPGSKDWLPGLLTVPFLMNYHS